MTSIAKELEENNSILLIVPSSAYASTMLSTVKGLSKMLSGGGIYVTLNHPYSALTKTLKTNNLNMDGCFFIDAITMETKTETPNAENCAFVSNPRALTELGLAIDEALKLNPKIIIFDSLSTLLLYSPSNTLVSFAKNLTTKLETRSIKAVFPVIKKSEFIESMSMFMDKVIYVEKKEGEKTSGAGEKTAGKKGSKTKKGGN